MSRVALVVPTIREDQIREFLGAWWQQLHEAHVGVYVVEDNERRSFDLGVGSLGSGVGTHDMARVHHLCWDDAPDGMLDCINVRSPGCRQIGLWKAYHDGCDVLVSLDDDVRPATGRNLFHEFCDILANGVPVWVDPLLNYRSRGYPTTNVGTVPVAFHSGSFLSIPDVDGETQLKYEEEFAINPPQYVPRATIVPKGQLIPVNGGICGWRSEITPFVHYTVWNKELGYRRFDDIWMGIIVKRLLDHCGLHMGYGQTFVNHIRASSAEKTPSTRRTARCGTSDFGRSLMKCWSTNWLI